MPELPEAFHDLLEIPVATLATIGPDGRPQVSAVWFLADADSVRLSLNEHRQKTKNLKARPGVNLFILDLAKPSRYIEIRGDAEVIPDDNYEFADLLGAKYGGTDLRTRDKPGEKRVQVVIHPARINTVDMSA